MAVNINSLVRTIGGQEKVIDKDKALLELANAIENGSGQTTNIVKCWSVYQDTITEIPKEVGKEKYVLEMTTSGKDYYFTTDEQQPDTESGSNIALLVSVNSSTGIAIMITKQIKMAQYLESHKDNNNNFIPPNGELLLYEGQQPILAIDLIYVKYE